jgi:hypothetical protein
MQYGMSEHSPPLIQAEHQNLQSYEETYYFALFLVFASQGTMQAHLPSL